jgi:hypothetical protein
MLQPTTLNSGFHGIKIWVVGREIISEIPKKSSRDSLLGLAGAGLLFGLF